jgi:hypothetical protein
VLGASQARAGRHTGAWAPTDTSCLLSSSILSMSGMVTMPSMLLATVSSSAMASLPLHERTRDRPTPSVVGTTQKSVRPAGGGAQGRGGGLRGL